MPVLVDPIRRYDHLSLAVKDWCHMAVDGGFEELHAFAAALGIPRHRFQGDHYDLPPWLRERAVLLGAEEVATGELLLRMAGPRGERARARAARRLSSGGPSSPRGKGTDAARSGLPRGGSGSV